LESGSVRRVGVGADVGQWERERRGRAGRDYWTLREQAEGEGEPRA